MHVSEILVEAHTISSSSPYRLTHICGVVEQDLPTVLLPEFITSLVLLHTRVGLHSELSSVFSVLKDLLDLLDKFNKLAPNIKVEDEEDLAWPGGLGKTVIILHLLLDLLLLFIIYLLFVIYYYYYLLLLLFIITIIIIIRYCYYACVSMDVFS